MDYFSQNWEDSEGNPDGGVSYGPGFNISWQRGLVEEYPNGAFITSVICALIDRLGFYQSGKFACAENAEALIHLAKALSILERRINKRTEAGTFNTHEA